MPKPKGLRSAEEVVPRLGVKAGHPALRVGDVALYDKPIEHLAGQLHRADLELPLSFHAARYGLVLCFALERCDARALAKDLIRVCHPEGSVWTVVWKKAFLRPGAPDWDEIQRAGLATGWVDNKILSLGDEVYATRFVKRRNPATAGSVKKA
ncbi:MAG: hypothetical protein HY071_00810 [Chloroflexi bacterium]|nr:hypothetical protein [Chloroflexota bacterium]